MSFHDAANVNRILSDLEYIYELSIAHKQLVSALRAKELIAKIAGILGAGKRRPSPLLHLHELSDEQLNLLISDLQQASHQPTLDKPQGEIDG